MAFSFVEMNFDASDICIDSFQIQESIELEFLDDHECSLKIRLRILLFKTFQYINCVPIYPCTTLSIQSDAGYFLPFPWGSSLSPLVAPSSVTTACGAEISLRSYIGFSKAVLASFWFRSALASSASRTVFSGNGPASVGPTCRNKMHRNYERTFPRGPSYYSACFGFDLQP